MAIFKIASTIEVDELVAKTEEDIALVTKRTRDELSIGDSTGQWLHPGVAYLNLLR